MKENTAKNIPSHTNKPLSAAKKKAIANNKRKVARRRAAASVVEFAAIAALPDPPKKKAAKKKTTSTTTKPSTVQKYGPCMSDVRKGKKMHSPRCSAFVDTAIQMRDKLARVGGSVSMWSSKGGWDGKGKQPANLFAVSVKLPTFKAFVSEFNSAKAKKAFRKLESLLVATGFNVSGITVMRGGFVQPRFYSDDSTEIVKVPTNKATKKKATKKKVARKKAYRKLKTTAKQAKRKAAQVKS